MLKRIFAGCAILFGGLIMLGFILYFGNRVRQRIESYYYNNLVLRPSEPLTGLTPELLAEVEGHLDEGNFGNVDSFLIYQAGEDRFTYYSDPEQETRLRRVFSIGKSVTSAAVGMALEDPNIDFELTDDMVRHLTDYSDLFAADAQKQEITLYDLITMQSGLDWNELSTPSDFNFMYGANDWVTHIIDREMAEPSGQSFTYNSGNTILISEIVGRQAGLPFDQYVQANLFDPLGIETAEWRTGAKGIINTGGGLSMRAEDMLKIGILFLQNGEWEGAQLISEEWVRESTQVHVNEANGLEYGYFWWQFPDSDPIAQAMSVNDLYFASGLGGNYIYVIPHLDAVIVIRADDDYNMERAYPALQNFILPALENELGLLN